jgi:GNAT superfamily N-acetyltransferase
MRIPRQFTFWTVVSRITRPFINAYYFFEADLSRQRPSLPARPDFCVRLYHGAAELQAAMEVLVPTGLTASDITARLQRGDLVAVGVLGDQTAAYTWASFTEVSVAELGRKVRARAGEVIQYDTLVLKSFRRHGLQFAVAQPVLDYAQENGYTRTLSWVNVLNRASCKNQWKWGKKLLLTAVILEVPATRHRWTFALGAPLESVFSGPETARKK